MSETIITEARELIQAGYWVFPVHLKDGNKKPAIKGYLSATLDPDEFEEVFTRTGANAIGMALELNGLVCVDVDAYKPECNWTEWLVNEGISFEDTMAVETGRGGFHYYFEAEEGKRYRGAIKGLKAVDIKHRGFTVLPPTEGYTWVNEETPAEAPSWLPTRDEVKEVSGAAALLSSVDTARKEAYEFTTAPIDALPLAPNTMEYEGWRNIAMGMHEGYHGTDYEEAALDALIEWTKQREGGADHEEIEEVRKIWQGFTDAGGSGRTLASVIRFLQDEEVLTPNFRAKERAEARMREAIPDGDIFKSYDRAEDVKLAPWIIQHIVRVGDMGGITGISGLGKTNLTAAWVAGLTAGEGAKVGLPDIDRPHTVAWANPEEPREAMKLRLDAAYDTLGVTPKAHVLIAGYDQLKDGASGFLHPTGTGGEVAVNEELVRKWIDELLERGVSVLFLDPLTEFNDGNENSRTDRKKLIKAIRDISQQAGLSTIYWAHTGKTPEGKRDDWYEGDPDAERGSSAGNAANNFGGTLTRVYPEGYKGPQARQWMEGATNPSDPTPNIVKLVVPKAKLSVHKPVLYWRIEMSEETYSGERMPVALPMSEQQVNAVVTYHASQNEDLVKLPQARRMIEVFGEGVERGIAHIHDRMRGHAGWPEHQQIRADKGAGKAILDLWARPLTLTHLTEEWTVTLIHDKNTRVDQDKVRLTITKNT